MDDPTDIEMLKRLWDEANRVIIDATYSGRSHQAMGVEWDKWNRRLGVPTTVLSTVLAGGAGVTALAGAKSWVTALLALVAAGLSAARAFLKPDEVAELHGSKGDRLINLRNDAIRFQQVDLKSQLSLDALTDRSKELSNRRNAFRTQPPQHIPERIYKKTKASIEAGESDYENDRLWRDYS